MPLCLADLDDCSKCDRNVWPNLLHRSDPWGRSSPRLPTAAPVHHCPLAEPLVGLRPALGGLELVDLIAHARLESIGWFQLYQYLGGHRSRMDKSLLAGGLDRAASDISTRATRQTDALKDNKCRRGLHVCAVPGCFAASATARSSLTSELPPQLLILRRITAP
eukprot:2071361-Amphidinium_carterae.3